MTNNHSRQSCLVYLQLNKKFNGIKNLQLFYWNPSHEMYLNFGRLLTS
jgi:hypothetical protein